MSQAAEQRSLQLQGGISSASTPTPDNPPPGSDIPLKCSLQWDAVTQQGDVVDAAIAELQARMGALADCILGTGQKADPWPPPAPGGEYVSASTATASPVSAVSYKRQQLDLNIQALHGIRRHFRELTRTR